MGDISSYEDTAHLYTEIPLCQGWSFRQTDKTEDEWLPVKNVPSTVHQDLIDNERLEDPFVGFNEIKAEWVGTKSWTYRVAFDTPSSPPGCKTFLAFDGLDTFAHVRLNGKTILETDNMFLPYRVDITDRMSNEETQDLEVEFDSALLKAQEIKAQHPEHKFVGFNGDVARMAARKCQCHYGWDWGPLLICAGIWRPVRLEIYQTKISDVRVEQVLTNDYKQVTMDVTAQIDGAFHMGLDVVATLSRDGKTLRKVAGKSVLSQFCSSLSS